jgi:hypothetical protein
MPLIDFSRGVFSFAVIEKPRARGLIRANWRINQEPREPPFAAASEKSRSLTVNPDLISPRAKRRNTTRKIKYPQRAGRRIEFL